MMLGPPEINDPDAKLLLVGRDYGRNEQRQRRPFVGRAGHVLNECLGLAGTRRESLNISNVVNEQPRHNNFHLHGREMFQEGVEELAKLIDRLDPNVIVALGNESSFVLRSEGWPTFKDTRLSSGIEEERGYVWEGGVVAGGRKVLTAVHPAAVDRQWVPWAALLVRDLMKAKRHAVGDVNEVERKVVVF